MSVIENAFFKFGSFLFFGSHYFLFRIVSYLVVRYRVHSGYEENFGCFSDVLVRFWIDYLRNLLFGTIKFDVLSIQLTTKRKSGKKRLLCMFACFLVLLVGLGWVGHGQLVNWSSHWHGQNGVSLQLIALFSVKSCSGFPPGELFRSGPSLRGPPVVAGKHQTNIKTPIGLTVSIALGPIGIDSGSVDKWYNKGAQSSLWSHIFSTKFNDSIGQILQIFIIKKKTPLFCQKIKQIKINNHLIEVPIQV